MATLLDAYPLIAFLTAEPAAAEVEAILRTEVAIPSVNLAEALDVVGRRHGFSDEELSHTIGALEATTLVVVPVDGGHARRAAALRRRHYRRRGSEVSIADCLLLAAVGADDRVATADPPVARAARAEGIDVVALPDSRGRRP